MTLKVKSPAFYCHNFDFLHSLPFRQRSLHKLNEGRWWNHRYYFLFKTKAGFSTFYIGLVFTRTIMNNMCLSVSIYFYTDILINYAFKSAFAYVSREIHYLCLHGDIMQKRKKKRWNYSKGVYPHVRPRPRQCASALIQ